ncbi:MAG: hypothetical protein WC263_04335 [Candidatus Micrarchaeia archaeon]|jgi:hypothetical protein
MNAGKLAQRLGKVENELPAGAWQARRAAVRRLRLFGKAYRHVESLPDKLPEKKRLTKAINCAAARFCNSVVESKNLRINGKVAIAAAAFMGCDKCDENGNLLSYTIRTADGDHLIYGENRKFLNISGMILGGLVLLASCFRWDAHAGLGWSQHASAPWKALLGSGMFGLGYPLMLGRMIAEQKRMDTVASRVIADAVANKPITIIYTFETPGNAAQAVMLA